MTSREIGCYFCTTFSSLYPIVQSMKKHLALPTTSSSSTTNNTAGFSQAKKCKYINNFRSLHKQILVITYLFFFFIQKFKWDERKYNFFCLKKTPYMHQGGWQQEREWYVLGFQESNREADVSYLMNLAIYLDIIHEQMQYWLVLFIHVFIKSELESDSSLRHIKHKTNYIYSAHKPQVLVCLT